MLPRALHTAVEHALGAPLRDARTVGGGCIGKATRVTTASGDRIFLKWCAQGELPAGIFQAEAYALQQLRAAHAVRVPTVIDCHDNDQASFSWLLLEWLEPAPITGPTWRNLGHALARLHRSTSERFGWTQANFIGSLPQSNEWLRDWPRFWRTQRLLPQLEAAARRGMLRAGDRKRFDNLLNSLDELLATGNLDGPSLVHGDLWNGNVHGADGDAALIDPASYFGHREVDLAMAALFGGFAAEFFRSYDEAWPLQAGAAQRKLIYQLYYLLVHVNLFGASYVPGTLSAVGELGF